MNLLFYDEVNMLYIVFAFTKIGLKSHKGVLFHKFNHSYFIRCTLLKVNFFS